MTDNKYTKELTTSIKKELFSGVLYTAISKYSGIIISLIVTVILARLLSPKDFGIMAIASVIINFFNIFTDLGLAPAIVQKKELSEKDLSNIFSFTVWIGVLLSVLFFFASWPIADYYENEVLRTLCQCLAINLFFSSANIVPNALFFKNKEFKFIAIRTFSIQFIVGLFAIIAALSGAGLYALLINPIVSYFLIFIISIRRYPQKLRFTLGLSSIKKIFSYSAFQFLFNVINYFSRNVDKMLIGKYINMTALGYYEKSYRLMMLPLQNITHVITPVIHPVFSDYQNDHNKIAHYYEKMIRFLSFISFPLTAFLFFSSREIILIVFGDQWVPSIGVFQILSLSICTQVLLSSSGSIFQACNNTKDLFICGAFSAFTNITSIVIGVFVFKDLRIIALFIIIAFTINFIQCYWLMYKRTFERSLTHFFKQLLSPFLITITIAVSLFFINFLTDEYNIYLTVILKGVVTALLLGSYIQLRGEYDLLKKAQEVIRKIKTKRK